MRYLISDCVLKCAFVFFVPAFLLVGQEHGASVVPAKLAPPPDERLMLQAHGVGDQIYTCKGTEGGAAWSLKAPEAKLLDAAGNPIGRHFAGPAWEATDGSRILGEVVANSPSPDGDSIPWLLLHVKRSEGDGAMSHVLSIQRLETKNGIAPAAGCDASHLGVETRVPYEAQYYFYGKR